MSQEITLNGMVLQAVPYGEYDRRIILLTKERGKITAFARGARRPTSPLQGTVAPFHFGYFTMYEGRDAYTLTAAKIDSNGYFQALKTDLEGSCYGSYFMELAAYYGRENLDASEMLNLLYVSLKALENEHLPNRLVQCVFEIRLMVINGEYPQEEAQNAQLLPSARYAIQYAISAPLGKLFTFTVSDEVLDQMTERTDRILKRTVDRKLKSLEILESMRMMF